MVESPPMDRMIAEARTPVEFVFQFFTGIHDAVRLLIVIILGLAIAIWTILLSLCWLFASINGSSWLLTTLLPLDLLASARLSERPHLLGSILLLLNLSVPSLVHYLIVRTKHGIWACDQPHEDIVATKWSIWFESFLENTGKSFRQPIDELINEGQL